MKELKKITIDTKYGRKSLSVLVGDIRDLTIPLDVMTATAFFRSYYPSRGTLFGALDTVGVHSLRLSQNPDMDMRNICSAWISEKITGAMIPIARLGCIETTPVKRERVGWHMNETDIISSLRAYFHMLRILSLSGEKLETLGMPIIGGGNQRLPVELFALPMLNECIGYLNTDEQIRDIYILTNNEYQAQVVADAVEKSYTLHSRSDDPGLTKPPEKAPMAFISYSSKDRNVADNLCAKLETRGVRVWYAPRNMPQGDYATPIVNAISECSHFVVILSRNSLQSQHVLSEIDLAFNELNKRKVRFYLLKLDEEEMGPAFRYYLSRQNWMDAQLPPLESRLNEFVSKIVDEM